MLYTILIALFTTTNALVFFILIVISLKSLQNLCYLG